MRHVDITCFPELDYPSGEALNTLCVNLTFMGTQIKKVMITSSHAAEGKTFVSMNVMRTMAQMGKRVVLIDTDLRRSFISTFYGLDFGDENRIGLAHYLAGMCGIGDILYETNIENACIIPAGRVISNTLPLLTSPKLGQLFDQIEEQFDFVLVDAAPVGLIIDAAQVAKSCDGTLFVVHYNEVHRRELLDAKRQIEQTGCPILGSVLNGVDFDSYSNRKYYYQSYYHHYGYGKKDEVRAAGKKGRSYGRDT